MKKILQNPSARARLGRSPHDLSRRVTFSSAPGMLLPVLFDFLSPGDAIKINDSIFTRTQPLKTAAFIRCNQYLDYFFVPMEQIDPYFGNSFFGIDDIGNTNDVILDSDSVNNSNYHLPFTRPSIDTAYFRNSIMASSLFAYEFNDSSKTYDVYLSSISGDEYSIPSIFGAFRLMDMLQYGSFWFDHLFDPLKSGSKTITSSAVGVKFNTYLLNCYQKIFYDYYRRSEYTDNNAFAYNIGYAYKGGYREGLTSIGSAALLLPTYQGMFKLRYHPLKRDFFTNIQPTPLYDPKTSVGGYAYDSFTGAEPQLNDISSAVLSSFGINLQDLTNKLGVNTTTSISTSSPADPNSSSGFENNYAQFGPNDIRLQTQSLNTLRFAYAYERMLMITQRGGRHYDSQVQAHFGVKVPKGVSGEVYYLGGHVNRLQIGEVISTAAGSDGSSTSSLGEIAGRGIGVSKKNKTIKFKAPCHGFLMAIQSTVPEVDYRDYGMNRINRWLSINDFPHPEFDHIGMQPLYYWQAFFGFFHDSSNMDANIITGWQYRSSELKLSYDIVHGAFNETLQDWSSSTIFGINKGIYNPDDYTIPSSVNNPPFTPEYCMYCPPTYLDNVFALTFAPPLADKLPSSARFPTGWLVSSADKYSDSLDVTEITECPMSRSILYSRDPFLNYIDFQYYKTSWMSTYSLPNT